MLRKIAKIYSVFPKEVKVFLEYILPSAIITALIDYLTSLQFNDAYVAMIVNVVLIFLREAKKLYP